MTENNKVNELNKGFVFAKGSIPTILIVTGLFILNLLFWIYLTSVMTFFLALFSGLIWGIVLYFFRDPFRQIEPELGQVLSPADGTIMEIITEHEPEFLKKEAVRVSIFLSLFNVHIQRAPVNGEVLKIQHHPGKFLQAFKPEASQENDNIAMLLDTNYGTILVKQIAGIMARRCVNYSHEGEKLIAGQRYGFIKFGSRVDLYLPPNVTLNVEIGSKVFAGITNIGKL